MKMEKWCIYTFSVVYCCLVLSVPKNPNMYTLTVDTFSAILSFTACTIYQAFLGTANQKTLLGGLGIQFLFMEELSIVHFSILRIVTNLAHTSLNSFYSGHLEIANYVLNNRPIGCCVCASLLTMSGARLVLIASPGFYQGINQKLYLRLSAMFITSVVVSDFLINHIRCLLIHSNNYETPTVSFRREEINISFQMSNQSYSSTTSGTDFPKYSSHDKSTGSECAEIKIIGAMIFISALLEGIKIVIYFVRSFKKAKKTAPALKTPRKKRLLRKNVSSNQQRRTNLKRSLSSKAAILTQPISNKPLAVKSLEVTRTEDPHVVQSASLDLNSLQNTAEYSSTQLTALKSLDTVGDKENELVHHYSASPGKASESKEMVAVVRLSDLLSSVAIEMDNTEKEEELAILRDEVSIQAGTMTCSKDIGHEIKKVAAIHSFDEVNNEPVSHTSVQSPLPTSAVEKIESVKCTGPRGSLQQSNLDRCIDALDAIEKVPTFQQSSLPRTEVSVETGMPPLHLINNVTECNNQRNIDIIRPTKLTGCEGKQYHMLLNVRRTARRRHSLPPLQFTVNSREEKESKESKALKPRSEVQWKLVYKPMKDFLLRSSTVTFVMSLFGIMVLVKILMRYDKDSSDSSISLLSSVVRIYTFVLPVLLVLLDDKVVSYAKGFFVN